MQTFGLKKKQSHPLEVLYRELAQIGINDVDAGNMTYVQACISLGASLGA